MENMMTVKTQVPMERVHDLLVNALEGGSNYWYMIQDVKKPNIPYSFTDKLWTSEREKDPTYIHQTEIPFNEGGYLLIDDKCADEPTLAKPVHVGLPRLIAGLQIMADKYPRHWADFVRENDDAETADVFLQCVVFGECIYG